MQGGPDMYSSDQVFSNAPYRLLIRARTQAQFEQAVIVIASRVATTAVSPGVAKKFKTAATHAVNTVSLREGNGGRAPSPTNVVSALQMLTDLDDWCGTPWPHKPFPWPWPWSKPDPHPDPWFEMGMFDVIALKTVAGLTKLVPEAGKELYDLSQVALKELGG